MLRSRKSLIGGPIEMDRLDEDILTPEEFLRLDQSERREILRMRPMVKRLGKGGLDSPDFVSILVKWKNPRYEARL